MYRYLPNIIYIFFYMYTLCIGRCGWSCLAFQSSCKSNPVIQPKSVASDQIRLGAGQMQMQMQTAVSSSNTSYLLGGRREGEIDMRAYYM